MSNSLKIAKHKIPTLTEVARIVSYIEMASNKIDAHHKDIKQIDEHILKSVFEFNTKKAIGRIRL